jgi:hypothetical protein
LLDNFFEPIHRAFKVKLYLARLRFAAHGENGGIKHSLAMRKGATCAVRHQARIEWHALTPLKQHVK